MTETLTENQKKTIFADIVAAQDGGTPVLESRAMVARKHGVEVNEVRKIEREGLDCSWPPL